MNAVPLSSADRVKVDGKFFRLGPAKFHVRGVTYGPFAPNQAGEMFASPERTRQDFELVRRLGANLLRLYYVPPGWFLDLAAEFGLKLLIDIPWPKHLCFFESYDVQVEASHAVRQAVARCKAHPAVFAYSVVNEIPAEIVRWGGVERTSRFIEELVREAKATDPDCLCTFASFPPTEFLHPRNLDFLCFNIYLHQADAFDRYLARLQMLADTKPLILGEFGLDSLREGEPRKCELLRKQVETACRAGLAGTVIYSFTDDWFRGGRQVDDWAFGLTTRDRVAKPSFQTVKELYARAPHFPLDRTPKVSVVVASYNGARTLEACLSSLQNLNYPDYEVILVDDGSTDNTQEIASRYPAVRNLRQANHGLSAARNAGIAAATGEIIAFTDSDCRVDEDWLYYLVGDMLRGGFTGIGGHNFLPPEDSPVAAAVMASPGGPAHVMLDDTQAEHIPGCNMAFYRWALEEIKGFDPVYRKAGDDVDLCWRLQERGCRIGFSPAGFVWHYRRSTMSAYLRQQAGYGEAEALLIEKHPEYFNALGGGLWRGRIYTTSKFGLVLQRSVIYHGVFGSGFFQKLYSPRPAFAVMLSTSLEFHVLVNLPLWVLSAYLPVLISLALATSITSLGICLAAAAQADLPPARTRLWSRPLVALLFFLQPIVRGWARYRTRLHLNFKPLAHGLQPRVPPRAEPPDQFCFWSRSGVDRYRVLQRLVARLEQCPWQIDLDTGWASTDLEIRANRWSRVSVTTVDEYLAEQKTFHRARLDGRWSGLARLVFAAALIGVLLVVSQLAHVQPWLWMLPLVLPLLAWFFDDEVRHARLQAAGIVDSVAAELDLQRHNQSPAQITAASRLPGQQEVRATDPAAPPR